jgi:serine phosphatase RsbU (regulator of sigma subunit)
MIPRRSLAIFFAAVFFIFAPVGLLLSSSFEQQRSAGLVALMIVVSGLLAVSWAGTFTVTRWFIPGIVLFSLAMIALAIYAAQGAERRSAQGTLEALVVVAAIVAGYVLFIVFVGGQGRTTVRLMTEMNLAARIHETLVPRIELTDEGLAVLGVSVASTEMGGDLVDVVRHENGVDLLLVDVSGHGVRAGVVMGMIKAAIRTQLRRPEPLARLFGELNEVLEQTTSAELYATMAGLRVQPSKRKVEYGIAGHHHVVLVRDGEVERLHDRNMPIGMMADQDYPTASTNVGSGDLLAAYTDGLNETADESDRELGHEPIERTITELRERPLAEIQQAVFDLVTKHGSQVDDRTLLLARLR